MMCVLRKLALNRKQLSCKMWILVDPAVVCVCVCVCVTGGLTSLGLRVGLDLQDYSGNRIGVHIVERVGYPLEPENTHSHTSGYYIYSI